MIRRRDDGGGAVVLYYLQIGCVVMRSLGDAHHTSMLAIAPVYNGNMVYSMKPFPFRFIRCIIPARLNTVGASLFAGLA